MRIIFQAVWFTSDHAEITYIISYFWGKAKAEGYNRVGLKVANSDSVYKEFYTDITSAPFRSRGSKSPDFSRKKIIAGLWLIQNFIEFQTLAADSGWNQPALDDAFYKVFSDLVKDQLIFVDLCIAYIALASKIDKSTWKWMSL